MGALEFGDSGASGLSLGLFYGAWEFTLFFSGLEYFEIGVAHVTACSL